MGIGCCKSEAASILPFTKADLVECVACTTLTQAEIIQLWRRFVEARRMISGKQTDFKSVSSVQDVAECIGMPWTPSRTFGLAEICSHKVNGVQMPFKSLEDNNRSNSIQCDPETPILGAWQYDPFNETLNRAQFASIHPNNPLADRMVDVFSERKDGRLSFEEFVDLFSVFHPRSSRNDKVKMVFKLFDLDGDGFLNPSDLKNVLYLVLKAGYDWDGRKTAYEQEHKSKVKELSKTIYAFLQYLDEESRNVFESTRRNDSSSLEFNANDELDGRRKARVETWVEATMRIFNERCLKGREAGEEGWENQEPLSDEDMRKMGKKLEEVAASAILDLEALPTRELEGWNVEDKGNPLSRDPATALFATHGFGKNLFREMAEQIRMDKHNQTVGLFIEVFLPEKRLDEEYHATKVHEFSVLLLAFLQEVDVDECLLQRRQDPAANDLETLVSNSGQVQDHMLSTQPGDWKQAVARFIQSRLNKDLVENGTSDDDARKTLWNEVVYSFLDIADVQHIVSKMMIEGDPSISEEDQMKQGWDGCGKISCQEFNRILTTMPDFDRFTMAL